MAGDKELITAHALAEALDLSVETIWRYTREKKIPCIELAGRQYRYKLDDVLSTLAGPNTWELDYSPRYISTGVGRGT
ncbi:MAG: helix-turn-helix domain-containing protein [Bacillota bacterium]